MKRIDESGIDLRNREEVEVWAASFAPKIADRIMDIYDASYGVSEFLMEMRRQYPDIVTE